MGRTSRGEAHGTPSPGARVAPLCLPQGANVDAVNTSKILTKTLTDAERIDRLRLIRSDNVGPRGVGANATRGDA